MASYPEGILSHASLAWTPVIMTYRFHMQKAFMGIIYDINMLYKLLQDLK